MAEWTFVEERMGPWPEGRPAVGCTVDGHMFTWIEESGSGYRFVWDGVPGEPMESAAVARDGSTLFSWSDDGRHVAFTGSRAGRQFVVRDGIEGASFESVPASVPLTFSADGRRLAYGAIIDGVHRLVLDGEVVGKEMLAPISIAFSPDGRRLAHVEVRGTGSAAEGRLVLDGVPGDWGVDMPNAPNVLQFSPNGLRFAYYRIDGRGHGQWIVDGDAHQWVNDFPRLSWAQLRGVILDPSLLARWSPDSARFAYFADVEGKGVAMVEDDHPGPLVKAIGNMIFSPDSRRLAYTVQTHSRTVALVVDGVISGEFRGEPSFPVFSADGRHIAVAAHREEGNPWSKRHLITVIVDGKVIHEEPGLSVCARPVFSPDGARLAYWIERTKDDRRIFIDGMLPDWPMTVGEPSYNGAGQLVYVGATDAGQTLVTDGRPGPVTPYVLYPLGGVPVELRDWLYHFRHSPDGLHVAWANASDDGAMPVLDEEIGPRYDQIINWSFDENDQATWWATRSGDIFRITARLSS